MATRKSSNKKSGFDAPVIGEALPKGTTFKKDANGRIIPVYPNEKKKKKKSNA